MAKSCGRRAENATWHFSARRLSQTLDSMSTEDALMRKSLKKWLVPALTERGFVGHRWEFQRRGEKLDLVTVQFGKYVGEFILEAASCPRGDLHTAWGEVVPEEKITSAHVSPLERARLEGAPGGDGLRGFSFVGFGEDQAKYEALARAVVGLLPELDHWLATRETGKNVRTIGAV
jgi:hypothetical protein